MDWQAIRFDWTRVRAFLVTAEEGSLSAAARALGLAQPTLGRQVEALERELGIVLFERVGKRLILTPGGRRMLPHARQMAEAATRLSLTAAGQADDWGAELSISLSEIYATHLMPPILAELRRARPDLRIKLVATSDTSDLLRREADIAIRNYRPKEPELIARKLRDADARLYATPDYLRGLGRLERPADLARAEFIGLDDVDVLLTGLNRLGLGLTPGNIALRSASFVAMWSMVRQGLGIGIVDDRIGDADPAVQRALPGLKSITFPVWLVTHRELYVNPALRFVFDFLARHLA